jgi:hypothetical protein
LDEGEHLIEEYAGSLTGVYPPGYLAALRAEWDNRPAASRQARTPTRPGPDAGQAIETDASSER